MSEVVNEAVTRLNEKMAGQGFDSTAKFVIENEGSVMIDGDGARAGDEDAEVTLTSDTETFQAILDGEENPTAAYMTGKLKLDGDMGTAMRLASILG
ncbi:SCP2 sterol-binding domain-containing protein [Histidinibacterium aquaticum]|uniref:SCP2 sterol-binding domain-containing protein n=1 Tax=Histidinibacterium aquaticum TaxID=2613962 RepID=A0A5J5GPH7_9RHOB|nr:SCP2 sterol-binding domain-containing protein [Histidinibacterium aquaticum]KAA9010239.1 SCP2 sterol-binding domain-containing protein [Histidinibacterium aquaticum]